MPEPVPSPADRPAHVVVAVNPTAAFGRHRGVGDTVTARLADAGHRVTTLVRPDLASLTTAALEAVRERPDAVVVVGGDGMVNLAAQVTAGTGVPFGVVPTGTGNDFARTLGIPHSDPVAATDLLLRAIEEHHDDAGVRAGCRLIDGVRLTGDGVDRWFACTLSAGFDARVNERANRMRRPSGPSRYVVAVLAELARLRPVRYRVVLDGQPWDATAVLISLGNGVSLGGGMKVTPDARPDDGLLDVMVVAPLGRLALLRIFPRVYSGTHVTDERVTIRRAARVRIEAEKVVAYADGERIGPLPVEATVVPGALRVLAPVPPR